MTTITPSRIDRPGPRHRSRGGFTLVEILIGATMSTMILAGVMSVFLFLGRSGINVQNYNDMEAQARKALEYFAEDVRQASSIVWTDDKTLTLTVNMLPVMYVYDDTAKKFYRRDTTGTKALVTGITTFQFKAYTLTGVAITDFSTSVARAAANKVTKQLQISLEAARSAKTAGGTEISAAAPAATNTVLSARFILRNKIVTA